MIELFKSRKSSMVIIGMLIITIFGIINKEDVTNSIVYLVGIYVTGNVAQKAATKKEL